jgi:hypothetical protein
MLFNCVNGDRLKLSVFVKIEKVPAGKTCNNARSIQWVQGIRSGANPDIWGRQWGLKGELPR